MVSLRQIWVWMIFGFVMVASAFFFVFGLADMRRGAAEATLGAVGLFGCVIVALQIRILIRLERIERRESDKGD